MTLSVLAAVYPQVLDGFRIFGIVKETSDQKGLLEFHNKYFNFPLYLDESYAFYQALGDRKIGLKELRNPVALFGIFCEAYARLQRKQVTGNQTGEGMVQGGLIIFCDKQPVAMYEEQTGADLRVADIVAALQVARSMMTTPKQADC